MASLLPRPTPARAARILRELFGHITAPVAFRLWDGHEVRLSATEFDLLRHFLRHPRQVLSREQLIDAVWKGEVESDNVVAVYVGYLRNKLGEPGLLHTVRGAGYSLHE